MTFIDDMKKDWQKRRARTQLGINKMRGKLAEEIFVIQHHVAGDEVKRTGHGSDYEVRKGSLLNDKKGPRILHEVKASSTAPVSKLQKTGVRSGKVKVVRPGPFLGG